MISPVGVAQGFMKLFLFAGISQSPVKEMPLFPTSSSCQSLSVLSQKCLLNIFPFLQFIPSSWLLTILTVYSFIIMYCHSTPATILYVIVLYCISVCHLISPVIHCCYFCFKQSIIFYVYMYHFFPFSYLPSSDQTQVGKGYTEQVLSS